jgi:hypothetical protein
MLDEIFSNSLIRAGITVAGIMLFPVGSVLGSESLVVTNTLPDSDVWGKLTVDAPVYINNSKLTFTDIPEPYVGLDYLLTANLNKLKTRWHRLRTSDPLISFDVNEDISAYVAMDTLASIPSWLNDWNDTGDQLVAEAWHVRVTYRVYRKDFSAGNVTLGGNQGYSSSNMYFVIVKGQTDGGTPVSDPVVSDPVPAPVPTVSLSSTASTVTVNDSTTLNWTASNADSCMASGAWSGGKATSGTESTAPLTQDTTFTLGCTGPGGSATQSITVKVLSPTGVATLSWTPPTTKQDGSALTNLAGYKLYYGTTPRSYSSTIVVANPGISTYVVENLLPATYYFVVTAFDSAGLESSFSNEASKIIFQ